MRPLVESVALSPVPSPSAEGAGSAVPLQRSQSLPHSAMAAPGGAPDPGTLSSSALSEREASRLDKFRQLLAGPNTDLGKCRRWRAHTGRALGEGQSAALSCTASLGKFLLQTGFVTALPVPSDRVAAAPPARSPGGALLASQGRPGPAAQLGGWTARCSAHAGTALRTVRQLPSLPLLPGSPMAWRVAGWGCCRLRGRPQPPLGCPGSRDPCGRSEAPARVCPLGRRTGLRASRDESPLGGVRTVLGVLPDAAALRVVGARCPGTSSALLSQQVAREARGRGPAPPLGVQHRVALQL